MTIPMEPKKPARISEFLQEVSQAETFQELLSAFHRIKSDFKKIADKDPNGHTKTYLTRFQILEQKAEELLKQTDSQTKPSVEDRALFGEMVALRDFCFKRLKLNG